MTQSRFHIWLARTLGQSVYEVSHLLSQDMAIEFLISWSLFESRCFDGFMKLDGIKPYAKKLIENEKFKMVDLQKHFNYFHKRYQDKEKREHLFQKQLSKDFQRICESPAQDSTPIDQLFYCVTVAYRFRNNMFHGSKGVRSWLQYQEQIELCSEIVQACQNHAESRTPLFVLSASN